MPFLVLASEKASGIFLIDQTKVVANNVSGTIIKGSGHWLMEEDPGEVMPAIVAFLKTFHPQHLAGFGRRTLIRLILCQ